MYLAWDTNGNTWYSGGNGDASGLGFYVRRLIQPWQNVGTLNNYDSIKSTYPSSQYEYGISYNGDVQRATCNGWNRGTRVAAFPFYPQGDSASGLWWGTTVFTRGLENGGSTWLDFVLLFSFSGVIHIILILVMLLLLMKRL